MNLKCENVSFIKSCFYVFWIQLVWDRVHWRNILMKAMKFRFVGSRDAS